MADQFRLVLGLSTHTDAHLRTRILFLSLSLLHPGISALILAELPHFVRIQLPVPSNRGSKIKPDLPGAKLGSFLPWERKTKPARARSNNWDDPSFSNSPRIANSNAQPLHSQPLGCFDWKKACPFRCPTLCTQHLLKDSFCNKLKL